MILTAAMEFSNELSQLLPSRPSDNVELSRIIASRSLPHVNAKTKERFMGMPYSVKARILLHSHLERVPLNSQFLETGIQGAFIVNTSYFKIFINVTQYCIQINFGESYLAVALDNAHAASLSFSFNFYSRLQ